MRGLWPLSAKNEKELRYNETLSVPWPFVISRFFTVLCHDRQDLLFTTFSAEAASCLGAESLPVNFISNFISDYATFSLQIIACEEVVRRIIKGSPLRKSYFSQVV